LEKSAANKAEHGSMEKSADERHAYSHPPIYPLKNEQIVSQFTGEK
jgi:hypothetical protein